MLAALLLLLLPLLLLPGGVGYTKMTDDTVAAWRRGGRQVRGREVLDGEEEELKVRDGQRGVCLSVPLCLLQPVPPLQHVM